MTDERAPILFATPYLAACFLLAQLHYLFLISLGRRILAQKSCRVKALEYFKRSLLNISSCCLALNFSSSNHFAVAFFSALNVFL